jgi:hypothetical protein
MKKQFASLFVVLALAVSIISCKKDSDPEPTRTDHITASSWKFEKATSGGIDVSSQVPACFKDNIIVFQAGGNGTMAEGADICAPPAPPTFTWSFQNNEAVLRFSSALLPGGSGDFNIVTLNATNLVISQDMNFPPFGNVNVVITFKH